jgi:putative flippase GtrA
MAPGPLQRLRLVLRSAGVGLMATGTDLVVLTCLVSVAGLSARLASMPALAAGVVLQFAGNKWFAFEDRSRRWVRQSLEFLAVEALGLATNLALFDLVMAHTALPYLPVRLATTSFVYFAICLPLWARVFRARGAES